MKNAGVAPSLVLAFALALTVSQYVLQPFTIPSGSMAPTLLGIHVKGLEPSTGVRSTHDCDGAPRKQLRAGDRIFVLKNAYAFGGPNRWEPTVFYNPEEAHAPSRRYFVKRIVGLPGEEILLVDGDVFTRTRRQSDQTDNGEPFRIARKPDAVQNALWRTVFASERWPIDAGDGAFTGPWIAGKDSAWETDRGVYRYKPQGPTKGSAHVLEWDGAMWPIDDNNPYNANRMGARQARRYPVQDVRVRGVVSLEPGASVRVVIAAHGALWRATIRRTSRGKLRACIGVRDGENRWKKLGTANNRAARAHHRVALCWVDQELQCWIDGDCAIRSAQQWNAAQRATRAKGQAAVRVWIEAGSTGNTNGAVSIRRLTLDTDTQHQPAGRLGNGPDPTKAVRLGLDEFFVLGDNSPSSSDSRVWDNVDPWVTRAYPETKPGVVPRGLLVGRVVAVYFPAPFETWGTIPTPDIGAVRLIR